MRTTICAGTMFIFLQIFSWFSCTSNSQYLVEIIPMDKYADPDAQLIGKKYVPEVFIYSPINIGITSDKLIIQDDGSEKKFKFFSYPEIKFLYDWGSSGKGPDQFTHVAYNSFSATNDGFYFIDLNKLLWYNFNDENRPFLAKQTELFSGSINSFILLNDEKYVAGSNMSGDTPIPLKQFRFLFPNKKEGNFFGDFPEENITLNVQVPESLKMTFFYGTDGVSNLSQRKFAVVYWRSPRAKIFDFSGNLLKEVVFNFEGEPENTSAKILLGSPFATNEYIYFLYINQTVDQLTNNPEHAPDLVVMNWEGKLIDRFKFDTSIISFVVSERYRKLYGINISQKEESNHIYEYDLPILSQ